MWTLQDAKNSFSAVVEAALDGRPQQVTRCKPAVVVISVADFARLTNAKAQNRGEFLDHLLARPVLEGQEDWLVSDRAQVKFRDIDF